MAASAFIASNTFTDESNKTIPSGIPSFTCNVNGNTFAATSNDSSLTTLFTYAGKEHNAPADQLALNHNLYKQFYIIHKTVDTNFYNSTNAPGNFEITGIDTIQHA